MRAKCPHCGGQTSIELYGDFETIACQACGWSQQSTVYQGEAVELINGSTEVVTVRIEWKADVPIHDQVLTARRVFQVLALRPIGVLLEDAKTSKSLDLGSYQLSQAIEIKERGQSNGLQITFGNATCP